MLKYRVISMQPKYNLPGFLLAREYHFIKIDDFVVFPVLLALWLDFQ